jgi:hypothetical protein
VTAAYGTACGARRLITAGRSWLPHLSQFSLEENFQQGQLSHRRQIILVVRFQIRSPDVDSLDVEPPVAANPKSWNLPALSSR